MRLEILKPLIHAFHQLQNPIHVEVIRLVDSSFLIDLNLVRITMIHHSSRSHAEVSDRRLERAGRTHSNRLRVIPPYNASLAHRAVFLSTYFLHDILLANNIYNTAWAKIAQLLNAQSDLPVRKILPPST
jgi:hypothetical protein